MKRILIVDDDVIIRIAFERVLKSIDYIVKQARNEPDAIQCLNDEIYDLILLDMRLPPSGQEAGFHILEKKKNLPLNKEAPVIIVSGQFDKETIRERTTEEDNIAEILLKPVDNEKILQAIKQVLG